MGLGTSECGLCPAGFGDIEAPAAPPSPTRWSRYIGTDGKYLIDGVSGNFARMPPLKQRIALAIVTELGSSTVLPGEGLEHPKKMGATFEADMDIRVRKALRRLTDVEQVMAIQSIQVERGSFRYRVTVLFEDKTSGLASEITVEPR